MPPAAPFLTSYLTMMDLAARQTRRKLAYPCLESFVLAHGEPFQPGPLPDGYQRGAKKMCFAGARRLARRHRELTYVEGFGIPGDSIPMLHAWCVRPDGRVIDPTWGGESRCVDPPAELFGVRFSLAIVEARWHAGEGVSLLDCPELRWPLLAERYTSDEATLVERFQAADARYREREQSGRIFNIASKIAAKPIAQF